MPSLLLLSILFLAEPGTATSTKANPSPDKVESPLVTGDQTRTLTVDGRERSYLLHVPAKYDRTKPTPVVLIFHGAATNAKLMTAISGLSKKSDEAGFLAVYPNGTYAGLVYTFNSGGFQGKMAEDRPDDVKFVGQLLDDLQAVANVDPRRVYATGLSNGGMMSYRLAAEMSDRIAAIAPVGGTMGTDNPHPSRPVPVLHFHGLQDKIVPYSGQNAEMPKFLKFKGVEESIACWVKLDHCPETPVESDLPDTKDDGTSVKCRRYGPGKDGSEVVLYLIEGGGHTWPGRRSPSELFGRSTLDISANDLMWEFFEKHPMPESRRVRE